MTFRIVAIAVGIAVFLTLAIALYQAMNATYTHIAEFEEPIVLNRFDVRDASNQILWRIDGVGKTKVSELDYGTVPVGYRQVTPSVGRPRALRPGEPLLLVYASDQYWTRHEGKAVGNAAFVGRVWLQGQRSNTPLDKVFSVTPSRIVLDPSEK